MTEGQAYKTYRYSVRVLLPISTRERAQTNRITNTSQSEGCREAGSPLSVIAWLSRYSNTGLSKQTDRNTVTRPANCNSHHNTCIAGAHSFWNRGTHSSTVCTKVLAPLFLRSYQSLSCSTISQYFTELEGSLPCSQEPSTGPYTEPDQSTP